MKKNLPFISFTVSLLLVLGATFFLQLILTQNSSHFISNSELIWPYTVNFILAFGITLILYMLRNKQTANLGFIFMGSSLVKFAVFFIWFYPIYNFDNDVSHFEFAQFFVPYAVSLTVETVFMVKILNRMD